MTRLLILLLVVGVLAGAFHWYRGVDSVCAVPVAYRIGTIDSGFGITYEEVRVAISDAETLWEESTGANLFVFDEDADLTINFLFDDRQERANEEIELRDILDTKEDLSDTIKAQYDALVARYENLKSTYEERVADYDERLRVYNEDVLYWNNEGGAPQDVFEELEERQEALNRENSELSTFARQLNGLVAEINHLGTHGNQVVEDYNQDVEDYNRRFNHTHEFAQGDYRGDSINIYQFDDGVELRIVLAHELGHALSLGHVDDPQSIMYYLMEGQLDELALSEADLEEYAHVCTR